MATPEGFGVTYEMRVDPSTGSLVAVVPLEVTTGRNGFTPQLGLEYRSSGANSPFGLGWQLSGLLAVAVDTSDGVPRYGPGDTFISSAAGRLVPVAAVGIPDAPDLWEDRGSHLVRRFRGRVEGGHQRIEQWVGKASRDVHWVSRDAAGTVTVYGRDPALGSRIADPADPRRVFQWLPELQYDVNGNAIRFDYAAENADGLDPSASRDRAYTRGAAVSPQRYLERVRWGNTMPAGPDGADPPGQRWCFELVFDYGDHDDADPGPVPDRPWAARPDPYSTYRPGFELRTYRLCRRILLFHRFDELGPEPVLVQAYEFDHDVRPEGSTLDRIRRTGFRRRPDGSMISKSQPALTFTYSRPRVADSFAAAPTETQEILPHGLDGPRFRWLDLHGEGLPGILVENHDAWYFKQNEGGGRFGPATLVSERPAYELGRVSIQDFDGDGNPDLAVVGSRSAGYYQFDRAAQRWDSFRPFPSIPHLDSPDSRAHWLDLDGDGRAELVVGGPDRITWFRSLGKEGFEPGVDLQPLALADVEPAHAPHPPPWRDDLLLSCFFADMTGDGLLDQVLVRNGLVAYWPNLGHGRFGAPVLVEDAPRFAPDGEFDPARLLFADLDGRGTADLVYLGRGEITYWTNASGNRLLPGRTLHGLPYIDNFATVRILDFLGDGTPCLVWSNPLGNGLANLQYLPLTDGVRSGLLEAVDNGMGLVRRIGYDTSASYYLADRAEGEPWHTRLSSHVTVVTRFELHDEIGGARSVRRYAYHDGCFDGRERRFVGFGCVEVLDTEPADHAGAGQPATGSCTRTYLHLGVDGTPSLRRSWRGDPLQPDLAPHVFEDGVVLDSQELHDALAAVAGSTIRQEVFEATAGGQVAPHPLRVEQRGLLIRRLQARSGDRPASFAVLDREQLTAVHEQQPDDPRTTHALTLEADGFGVPVLACSVAYPRRAGAPVADPEQQRTAVTVERTHVLHRDTDDEYQLSVGVEHEVFELSGLVPPPGSLFSWSEVRGQVTAALAAPVAHDEPAAGPVTARRTGWSRTYYCDEAGGQASLGTFAFPARAHHIEEAAFSAGFAGGLYGPDVDALRLQGAGYRLDSGHWWRVGEVFGYAGAADFRRLEQTTRTDGGVTGYSYDAASLLVVRTVDPLGNEVRIEHDYHVLAPARTVDENGNVTEVAYDPLGLPVFVTRHGEVLDDAGTPQAYGFDPLGAVDLRPAATVEDAVADPAGHVQTAAQAAVYDLDRWTARSEPPAVVRILREDLVHDGTGGDGTGGPAASGGVLVSVTFLDGFARPLQERTRVGPGPAVTRGPDGRVALDAQGSPVLTQSPQRWLVSGHAVFDARQLRVRQYEPFFSTTWAFESDAELSGFGVAQRFTYDALGRDLRHDSPNGTHSRVEYGPWSARMFDPNDTVEDSAYRAARESLPLSDPERQALERARPHAGTPTDVHLDPRGREVLQAEDPGDGTLRTIRTSYDDDGNVAAVVDARGITSARATHDLLGRVLHRESADAGTETVLLDVFDRPVETWDARGTHLVQRFDVLDRPLSVDLEGPGGSFRRIRVYRYGDDPALADGQARNARGRPVECRDESGIRTIDRYTPDGDVVQATRRVLADHRATPDWAEGAAGNTLLADSFTSRMTYDGLGRVARHTLPDGATLGHAYARDGELKRITITTDDGQFNEHAIFDGAEFNARAQRVHAHLGNGVTITNTFDPLTWRTSGLRASRQSGGTATPVQDLEYTYDPAGNIARSLDRVHQPDAAGPYIAGLNVSAERTFRYDALYQLVEATGRIHRAVLPDDHRTNPSHAGTVAGARRLSLNDGGLLERYTQTFSYDPSGNITRMRHHGVHVNWTRDFWVSPTSNRSLPALDGNGNPVSDPESHFDATGNCVRLPHLRALDWDHRGMPVRAVVIDRSASGQVDDAEYYQYDAGGTRIRKVTQRLLGGGAVETVEVLYLDGCEIRRIRRNTDLVLERRTTHVHDGLARIALVHRWATDTHARETDDASRPRIHYQLTDHLGSAVLQLDEAGQVIAYEEYLPFGDTAFVAGDDAREVAARAYRYSGKERDEATGLYYFQHRYYASWIGRWLTPDPAGPVDGPNLYQYVRNNPISNFDPDGLQATATRGRERDVVAPTPGEVTAAFNRLDQTEQERLRGLMQRGNFAWFFDFSTRQIHFGTKAEIQRLAEAALSRGEDIARVIPPGSAPTEDDPDADGGGGGRSRRRRGTGRTRPARGPGGRSRRGRARGAATPGRGGRRTSGGKAGSSTAPPPDGSAGQARGPDGAPGDSTGTGGSDDTGANATDAGDGSVPGTPPGTGGDDNESGGGNGTSGTGPGANPESTGTGTGGGGTAEGPEAVGSGDTGTGIGAGEGAGEGTGDGTGPGESAGPGSGSGARAGSRRGARRSGRPGGRPGGIPGGTGTGTAPGGAPGGSPAGAPGGAPGGSPAGTAGSGSSGTPGTGTDAGTPGNTPSPTGDPNGTRTGAGAGGSGSPSGNGPGGRGEEPGGRQGGGGRQAGTVMDRVVQVAGWWHLEFSGEREGQSGGIPGGMGSLNLGAFGQALFAALTVADIALTVVTLGGLAALKTGLRLAATAARQLARRAATALRTGLRRLARRGRDLIDRMVDYAARGKTTRAFERAPFGQFRLSDLSIGLGDWRVKVNKIWLDPKLQGLQRVATGLHERVHWFSNQFLPNIARFKQFAGQGGWRGFIGSNVKFYEESVAYTLGGLVGSLNRQGWRMKRYQEIFGFHAAWTRSLRNAPTARRHVIMGLPFVAGGAGLAAYAASGLSGDE